MTLKGATSFISLLVFFCRMIFFSNFQMWRFSPQWRSLQCKKNRLMNGKGPGVSPGIGVSRQIEGDHGEEDQRGGIQEIAWVVLPSGFYFTNY